MKLFKRLEKKSKETATKDHDRVTAAQADLVHVANLSVNAKFYERRVEEGQIRILTVQPGSHLDPVSCIMRETTVKDAPKYDAISYCWIHSPELMSITVNGFDDFKVPVHLRACLRRIRHKRDETNIWIDAICINQADEFEKSEQVRQMPKIYGECWQTSIWLGDTEPDVPSCPIRDNGYCATGGFSSIEHGSMLQLLGDVLQVAEENSLRPDPKYLLRVWWKRLWCVQEFLLSPRVPRVMVGPHLVGWSDFLAASRTIVNPIFKGSSGHPDDWQTQNRKRSLLELLRMTSSNFACTDPRDRIFALLGITNDAELSIQADYAKSPEDVYSEATVYLIKVENNIDMLSDQRSSRSNSSLPTWVPDFMNLKDATVAGTPDGFRASSEKPIAAILHRSPSIACGCTGSCLSLRAIRFDRVSRRVAIEAECSTKPANQIYRVDPTHFFRGAPDGRNHSNMSGPRYMATLPARRPVTSHQGRLEGRLPPRLAFWLDQMSQDASFLDFLLGSLAIDSSHTSATKLDPLPQVGLLLLDYLFNGTQSLEQAVMHYRQHFTQNNRNRKMVQHLMQRHGLSPRQTILHDLHIALEVQTEVLDKIAKTNTLDNVMMKALELVKWGHSYDVSILSDLLATIPGRDTVETVTLADWQIEPIALTVDMAEIKAGVQKSTSGHERAFFKTDGQHLGVGPGDLQEGDEVVVPFGSSRPWVLRSHGDHHILVGDAFVPGIMTGQLEELWKRGELNYTDYVLR